MHPRGSLVSPLLSGVFCQCRSEYQGSDPGGGGGGGGGGGRTLSCATSPSEHRHDESCDSPNHCPVCGGPEQEHRLKVLFQILDVNGDGGICVNDLTIGLKKLGVHRTEHELRVSIHYIGLYNGITSQITLIEKTEGLFNLFKLQHFVCASLFI